MLTHCTQCRLHEVCAAVCDWFLMHSVHVDTCGYSCVPGWGLLVGGDVAVGTY